MTTICLNMIVRNEAKVIRRALDSVADIIDYWVICDTGSTDDTAVIIKDYFSARNIPGDLHTRTWVNFGHNRSEALDLASKKGDYLLLIDADMVLQTTPDFDADTLNRGSYLLQQHSGTLSYYNKRLLRNELNWQCIGVTHEYYGSDAEDTEAQLPALWINDIGDGGSKQDKYERDITLLEQGLRHDPANARYHFYLAQSYKDVGKTEAAIKMFDRRVSLGGWDEEIWYARYMKGTCLIQLRRDQEAIDTLQAAFDDRPWRAEPLVPLCEALMQRGEYTRAFACAQLGNSIPYPDKDRLFIDTTAYQWRFDYLITLCSYFSGDSIEGGVAIERLLAARLTPAWVRQNAVMNQCYYIKALTQITNVPVITKTLSLEYPDLNYTNPSVLLLEDGYLANLRGVNFYVEGKVYYEISSDRTIGNDTPAVTSNFLQALDNKLNSSGTAMQVDTSTGVEPESYPSPVFGYEDGRLIEFDGDIWLLCTCRHHRQSNTCQMALLRLNDNGCDRVLLLHGHEDTLHQKNWMPFVHEGELLLVYACEPLTILRPNLDTGLCELVSSEIPERFSGHLRGGSQGIRVNDYILFIVHEVADHADGRHYYHRFLVLDENLKFVTTSQAFYLQHLGIEFVAGLTLDRHKNELIIAWGFKDCEARLSRIALSAIINLLSLPEK